MKFKSIIDLFTNQALKNAKKKKRVDFKRHYFGTVTLYLKLRLNLVFNKESEFDMERTLVIIKPDVMEHSTDIINSFKKSGYKIIEVLTIR